MPPLHCPKPDPFLLRIQLRLRTSLPVDHQVFMATDERGISNARNAVGDLVFAGEVFCVNGRS